MKKKLLLIGSSGFFGQKIKKKLSNKYLILSPSSKKLNLLSVKSLNNYFLKNKIEIIINSAWYKNSTTSSVLLRTKNYLKNLKAAKNITQTARKYKIRYFLNISSINAYQNSDKKLYEKNLLKKSLNQSKKLDGLAKLFYIKLFRKISNNEYHYKNLLFSNIYGFTNRHKNLLLIDKLFFNLYKKKNYRIKIVNKSNIKIDLIYIDDAVDAIEFFLKKLIEKKIKHNHINIGSGKKFKLENIIDLINRNNKLKISYSYQKKINKKKLIASISLAKRYGWKPKITIIEGLKKTELNYKTKLKYKISTN